MTEQPPFSTFAPRRLIVATKEEEHITVRVKDWERLRERAASIQKNRREFTGFAWTMVGMGGSALLSFFAWLPAAAALPAERQADFIWVTATFICVVICSAVFALGAFWGAHLFATSERTTATQLVNEMDAVFAAST